jgi:RHS repeat-associated protein
VSQREFIGQFHDEDTDLEYLNARYYEANRGHFLSQDPTHIAIGNPGEIKQITGINQQRYLADPQLSNSYAYARGNPIVYKDQTGNSPNAYGVAFVAGAVYGAAQQFEYDRASGTVSSVPQYMKAEFTGGFQAVAALGAIQVLGPAGALRAYGTYETGANIYDFTQKALINESSYSPQQKMQSLSTLYRDLATRAISVGVPREYRVVYESLRSIYDSLEKIYNQAHQNASGPQSSTSGTKQYSTSGSSQSGIPSGKDSNGRQIYCYGACKK